MREWDKNGLLQAKKEGIRIFINSYTFFITISVATMISLHRYYLLSWIRKPFAK